MTLDERLIKFREEVTLLQNKYGLILECYYWDYECADLVVLDTFSKRRITFPEYDTEYVKWGEHSIDFKLGKIND